MWVLIILFKILTVKVCDSIKVRVRAFTGRGVEEWGGCDAVDVSIAWESDCAEVRWKLDVGKLED